MRRVRNAAIKKEDRRDNDGIRNLSRQRRSGDGGNHNTAAAGKLTAEIGGADADQRDPHRLFQAKGQPQQQGEVDVQGVKLLGGVYSHQQPERGLEGQKNRAQRKENDPIPLTFAPPGKGHAQSHAEKKHQREVDPAQNIYKSHFFSPRSNSNAI